MLPVAHAAIGYLLYSGLTRIWDGEPPQDLPTLWLLFGTQFPDLVDKPLAWTFGILPSGRSLAHSLVVLIPLTIALYVYFARRGQPANGVAFGVGALSHTLLDALPALLAGEFGRARFLLWPILPHVQYAEDRSIIGFLLSIELSAALLTEAVFGLVIVAVWWWDGKPGLTPVVDLVRWIGAAAQRSA